MSAAIDQPYTYGTTDGTTLWPRTSNGANTFTITFGSAPRETNMEWLNRRIREIRDCWKEPD